MTHYDEWRASIFGRMLYSVHCTEQDNFDSWRYPRTSPLEFHVDEHANYLSFFVDNTRSLFEARELFVDVTSRELFDLLILFRLIGHLHIRLPMSQKAALEQISVPEEWKVADTSYSTSFGPLSVFDVPVDDAHVWLKCLPANVSAYLAKQYYFERDNQRVAPRVDDYVVDAGGCFGDTALFFAHRVGAKGRVYTFDPLSKHCEIMREAFALNSELQSRISIFEAGLSDEDKSALGAQTGETINPGARVGSDSGLALRTIDSAVGDGSISRVDFIKMDIEGSELSALRGAVDAMKRWRPRLAISLYHRHEDFFAIPLWVNSLNLGYRFFLDHYSIHHEETVMYAIA